MEAGVGAEDGPAGVDAIESNRNVSHNFGGNID